MIFRTIIALCLLYSVTVESTYMTYYADEECLRLFNKETASIHLSATQSSWSSVILKATRTAPYSSSKNCTINLIPNKGYGIVLSIREIDFSYLPSYCTDYLSIYDGSVFSPVQKCGYYLSFNEQQSYSTTSNMTLFYHSGDRGFYVTEMGFHVIVTAYSTAPCRADEFRCANNRCIWSGLKCDDHNNCGDNSDERFSLCDDIGGISFFSENVILIVCFGIVVGVAILTSCALFCLRMKRWRADSVTSPPFHPHSALHPYHSVHPTGQGISRNPAGPNPYRVQGDDGGFANPCYAANYPDAPPPYKP